MAALAPTENMPPPSGDVPASIGEEAQPNSEVAAATEETPANSEDAAGAMPDAQDEKVDVVASSPEPLSSPTESARVRKYWVLKFDPPPKFRE